MSTSRVFTAGQVLTAAQMNDLPQGLLGKTTTTADSAAINTTETDVITAPAVTVAGTTRRLKITFTARGVVGTVANDLFIVRIKEGATILEEYHFLVVAASVPNYGLQFSAYVDSPTAASHTYKATLQRASGSGNGNIAATSTAPMVLAVEDIGQ